ncbi:hypothetical protein AAFF_G00125550 [Aldrovandia affinis]|uniref:Uncharacterized protein n=1 Tax=Aldrovandia affinis TaxID=143900 RepID=A0AAD7WAM2_9TELE|nr:hypothetical protein AAFF_G00125550 [Aldrovandia affinis]
MYPERGAVSVSGTLRVAADVARFQRVHPDESTAVTQRRASQRTGRAPRCHGASLSPAHMSRDRRGSGTKLTHTATAKVPPPLSTRNARGGPGRQGVAQ